MTNPVTLTIMSVEVDSQGEIKDIKPPLEPLWKFEDLLPYIVAVLAVALLAVGVYYYRKKRRAKDSTQAPVVRKVPPHEEALAALRALESKRLWQQGKLKLYYSEVTEIVRRYIADQWRISALEMTSYEIIDRMQRVPPAQPVLRILESFLVTADLVKFAKYRPTADENNQEMTWAYELVRAMIPPPAVYRLQERKETVDVG